LRSALGCLCLAGAAPCILDRRQDLKALPAQSLPDDRDVVVGFLRIPTSKSIARYWFAAFRSGALTSIQPVCVHDR
jgi:hypothetical protein